MPSFPRRKPAPLLILTAVLSLGALALATVAEAQDAKSSSAPSGNAENGKQLFAKYGCYECHGREGQGSSMTGPRLAPNPIPYESVAAYIRKPKGEMPPYTEKVLSDRDLADIYAFLQTRKAPPTEKATPMLK